MMQEQVLSDVSTTVSLLLAGQHYALGSSYNRSVCCQVSHQYDPQGSKYYGQLLFELPFTILKIIGKIESQWIINGESGLD
jgi:hypothetical protein